MERQPAPPAAPCPRCSHSAPRWTTGTGSAARTGSAQAPGPACCWHAHPSCSEAEAFGTEKWPSTRTTCATAFRGLQGPCLQGEPEERGILNSPVHRRELTCAKTSQLPGILHAFSCRSLMSQLHSPLNRNQQHAIV